jgi:hypothetical protein
VSATEPRYAPRLGERTPLDWRALLLWQLHEQREASATYEAYYDGHHPLQFATAKFREAFGGLFGAFADNWCQIVVDAAVERLRIVGFQVGGKPSTEAWALWQRNRLDVESVIAHTEAGKSGRAYLLVDPNGGDPRITVEHSSQVVVACDPSSRHRRLAAVKHWLGDDGYQYATLYLPEVVLRYQSSTPTEPGAEGLEWVPRDDEAAEVVNPLGVVPVIPLENKPGLLGAAHSDLEPALPLQDAINKECSDMLVASEYGAFPQRVITGWESPKDPDTGKPLFTSQDRKGWLEAALSRVWTFGDPDVTASSLPAADLANFVAAIEMFVQHLAAQTKTPPHYLLGQVVNASGDALSVAEAGLVSKCRSKTLFYSDSWEEAVALALTAAGQPTDAADCEAMWANPERVSLGALVDAAVKKATLGVPRSVLWLELGYTPQQITEMENVAAPEPPTPPTPPPTPPPAAPPSAPTTPGGSGG